LLGGVAGGLVGGITGFYIGGKRCVDPGVGETCHYLDGGAAGVFAGVTLGVPVGAHLLNQRRGSLPLSLLASVAIAGAGIAAFQGSDANHNDNAFFTIVIGVPVLQVVTSTVIESVTSRR
jgi:hypothetical protein